MAKGKKSRKYDDDLVYLMNTVAKNQQPNTFPVAKNGDYIMKINPKYFTYENLPCKGCKKDLMAEFGMKMDPGPRIPGTFKGSIQDWNDTYYPEDRDLPYSQVQGPVPLGTPPDTSKIPLPFAHSPQTQDTSKQNGFNVGNTLLGGMLAFDALLPNNVPRHQVVQPQMTYNPTPYGHGSQAIMQDGGGISPFGNYGLKPAPQPSPTMKIGDRNVDIDTARQIIAQAKKNKVDPYEALAIAYQESGIEGNNRAYHLNPNEYGTPFGGAELGIKSIMTQDQYARALQKKGKVPQGDAYRLQGYNGYGTIKKGHADLEGANSIYGIPIPDEGINMKKNPLYGKRILDIVNKTLKTNPQLRDLIDKGEYGYVLEEDENNTPSAKDGHWIQKAVNPAHKGYCTPMTKSTCTPKRKALAKTFKKMAKNRKKDDGGIIPDNMSNFSPHYYEQGGNVNGGAKIKEVGPDYPNTDLLEQWLLYKYGGDVNGDAKVREVGPNYPNTDLMEQWLLYDEGGPVKPGAPPSSERAPIYTSNPNDPRLRAFKDSTDLYNLYKLQERLTGNSGNVDKSWLDRNVSYATDINIYSRPAQKRLRPTGYNPITANWGDNPIKNREEEAYERRTGKSPKPELDKPVRPVDRQLMQANTNPNIYFPDRKSADIYHKTIKPSGYYADKDDIINYKYAQPVQPIEYQAPNIPASQPPVSKNSAPKVQPYVDPDRYLDPSNVGGIDRSYSDINIPQGGYRSANVQQPKTNYSITFPEGNEQRSAYFPTHEAWNQALQNFSPYMISSQESANGQRASAALKNRPMKAGGTARGGSDTTDLLEQWIPWMTGEYTNGGTLSPDKAKEMLKDGTAHGKKLTKKQKEYFGMVAAGKAAQGMKVGDPEKPLSGQERYYQSSAKLSYYKDQLNQKLKAKNPQAYQDYFKGLADLRRAGNTTGAQKYVQDAGYNEYLTPQEVQASLGDKYPDYLSSIRDVNSYNVSQGQQPLYGNIEGQNNLNNLNYGRRFASLQITPSIIVHNKNRGTDYERRYNYNPGTGSVDYTETGDQRLRPDYLSSRPTPTITFDNGGVMYDDGGSLDTMWGGSANLESYNPYDGGTVGFDGASHDNGGIGMQYNGNPVEVEGGEYASRDGEGNLTIYGNMYIPGTKTKFKKAAKAISDKEKRYNFLKEKGSDLVNNSNPANKYEQMKFNAGRVMMDGGEMGQKDLASKKEKLAALQKSMLDLAGTHGLDPQSMSQGKMKKAKRGASIPFFEDGGDNDGGNDPTRADRNNNPGNIKYGKLAKKYGAKKDKDGFAIFKDRESGQKAMQELLTSDSYKNMSAKDAINKWTGGHPYRYDLGPLTDKKISEMDPDELSIVMGTMTKGEGTRYGMTPRPIKPVPTYTPYGLPNVELTPEVPGEKPKIPTAPYDKLQVPTRNPIKSNVESLHMNQILPELFAAATNKVEPVPAQRYEPQLYEPYQVSFQDRLNQNQAAFNAQMRSVGSANPSAIGALAAQKYQADSSALGDEFRTNQAIANDITNKNISLVNDANLKNLGIADTQMVRQSQARSKTREFNQMILNSLSGKYAQNEFENKRLAAYENLYDYRFVPQKDGGLSATYFGPNAMFNYDGRQIGGSNTNPSRTISRYDAAGNLKGYAEYDDSEVRDMQKLLQVIKLQRTMPLMEVPQLNGK